MKRYQHYKGGMYLTLSDEAVHTETNEKMVVYCDADKFDSPVYVRPYDMFHGFLEDGSTKRFMLIDSFDDGQV